uniref:Uncharacterized protein n=1 Tax=viral metagenome TaxID=1070528 RepID=A0A6C0I1B3_9ZZZZ
MPSDPKQGQLASLIISIIILIIVIILIIIVCCNWYNTTYTTNNTNNQPRVQNPQALAAAAMYKNNQGMNINRAANMAGNAANMAGNAANRAANAVRNNPQKAALGAYAYNQRNY